VPSVENFYWILFENLLKPVGLDCYYYYPFATTDFLSVNEFSVWTPRQEHHVLLHFDQEPIWQHDLGRLYDVKWVTWSSKICKILANSERSSIKKTLCQDRGLLDWYYFYHGFAALDWFGDAYFIEENYLWTKVFSSLNHLISNHRSYRMALTARLLQNRLQPFAHISFHGNQDDCVRELNDINTKLSDKDKILVEQNLITQKLPIVADLSSVESNFSAHFGYHEYKFWQDSLVHVVNETVFYDQKLHLTEKIFKPIVALRPFLLVAAPGNLAYLRSYGFQTFSPWFDESYDNESDPSRRLDMITAELRKLCGRSQTELRRMHHDMLPVLEHNKKHFFGKFREIIVHELVDNFETCVRTWNNGRVDGRERPLPSNLLQVKKILLG
jgi:hypothetical protein